MSRHINLCVVALAGFLAGCNQPAVTLKAPAFQSSENTVRDWNDVADRIATNLAALNLLPNPMQPAVSGAPEPRPVFVRVQAPDSAFVQQVAARLESDVLQSGAVLARNPVGATVVNLDINFIRWGPRDKPPGLAGTLAAAASVPWIVMGASAPMSTWTTADAAGAFALSVGHGYSAWIASIAGC